MDFEKGKEKLRKSKQGFFRILFSRFAICLFLVFLQIWGLFVVTFQLGQYMFQIYAVIYMIMMAIVIYILNKDDMNPAFKLVWIIPIMGFPVFGIILYFFITMQPQLRLIQKRFKEESLFVRQYCVQDEQVWNVIKNLDSGTAGLMNYLREYNHYPVYDNTESVYYKSGELAFESIKEELKKAKHFIFLEYFIIKEGRMLNEILDILEEKVKEGVTVRFIYDGMCSLTMLPYGFAKQIRARGIECRVYAPVIPALSTYQNNRDHRKIIVIDNQVAFTGGINLADEYINEDSRFGYWKDNAIKLEGAAVRSFTIMFLQMWHILKRERADYEKFLIPYEKRYTHPVGFTVPYSDSPVDGEQTAELVYISILSRAKKYVHIMTPYLILDNELLTSLKFAAKRGVEVSILMPGIPDKKYAFWLAKTYYDELIASGVSIYEYQPGFVHSKVFVSDDETAVVGTINLDFRSLFLHHECASYFYRTSSIDEIEQDFQEAIAQSKKVSLNDYFDLPIRVRVCGKILRLLAPMM